MKGSDEKRFASLVDDLKSKGHIAEMKNYKQHGRVSTYDHCYSVAKLAYGMDKFLHTKSSEKELVRGAMLHDYYLYDWHLHDGPLHGPYHPKAALFNALRDFTDLTDREKNIIASHMWPLAPSRFPKYKEAVIVCIADKIVSTKETLFMRKGMKDDEDKKK